MAQMKIMNGVRLASLRGALHCPRSVVDEAIRTGAIYHETIDGVMYVSPSAAGVLTAMMAEKAGRSAAPAGHARVTA